MKRLIETLKNIWKIKELRRRILFTLALIFVYRYGSFVVLPGVVPGALVNATKDQNSLFGLINMFTGGAFNKAAIFALGIMPYITASIIVQLMGFAVPYFQRLQNKEGESGRKKISQITRILTLFITLVQGGGYLTYLMSTPGVVSPHVPPSVFWFTNIILLSTGTIFAMWMGEKITDKGIGNGVSLLIMVGIIARFPAAIIAEFTLDMNGGGLFKFIVVIALFYLITMATIAIVQAVRKIPIQFAKRMVGRGVHQMPVSGARDYIPVKLNAAGVMPIIFAQAIMFLPVTIVTYIAGNEALASSDFLRALTNPYSVPSSIFAFLLVVVFTYVYTALIVDPKKYAEYLKQQNAFIPGVKPGKATSDYIDAIVSRITLPGAVFLGIITILPAFAVNLFGVTPAFATFFGGTSLIILVGVVLDTLQQVESYLLMRKYDGLVKSGKIMGRASGGLQGIGAPM